MSLIRIDRQPPQAALWTFAVLWTGCFAAAGVVLVRSGRLGLAAACWAAATLPSLAGCLWPAGVRYLYAAALYATFPLGWTLSHLVLAAVYYLVLTPVGLLMRLGGHDPLQRRLDRDAETYWVPRAGDSDVARYFRQF